MDRIRVVLADDHAILRDSLRAFFDLQPDIEVVGEATSGLDAVQETMRLIPDLLLLDLAMPDLDGLEVARRLKQQLPQCKVVILSQYSDPENVLASLRSGADGYVLKKAGGNELLRAIRVVADGDVYLHPAIAHLVVEAIALESNPEQIVASSLTNRELQVLAMIAEGKTNRHIADALFISMKTVDKHRASLLRKLDLPHRAALIHYAVKHAIKP